MNLAYHNTRQLEAHAKVKDSTAFLITDLRALHKSLCVDSPCLSDIIAERAVLDLITQAVAIRDRLA